MRFSSSRTIAPLIACIMLCFLAACASGKKMVSAEAIDPLIQGVTNRHDSYVSADPNLTDVEKTTYIRSSQLLKKTMDTALERGTVPQPSP